jgi:hypothetical protein
VKLDVIEFASVAVAAQHGHALNHGAEDVAVYRQGVGEFLREQGFAIRVLPFEWDGRKQPFCMDGLASYPTTIERVFFRQKLPRHGERGRCALVEWSRLHLAQVVKQYEKGRVVGVARRIYQGSSEVIAAISKATQGAGDINMAYIKRLNGTFR